MRGRHGLPNHLPFHCSGNIPGLSPCTRGRSGGNYSLCSHLRFMGGYLVIRYSRQVGYPDISYNIEQYHLYGPILPRERLQSSPHVVQSDFFPVSIPPRPGIVSQFPCITFTPWIIPSLRPLLRCGQLDGINPLEPRY